MGRLFERRDSPGDTYALLCLAAVKLLLHLFTNTNYGFFRDELYYIACAARLDWGYVDQSPLIAVFVRAVQETLGESLFALRLLPALAGAALVFLTGIIARELGGGRYAQILAALCTLIAPGYLGAHSIMTMNAFEPLLWTLCLFVALRIFKGSDRRLWFLFGALAGIALMNKHSTLLFGFSFAVGLLLTRERRHLTDKWLWLGGLIAFLIFLPNVVWQWRHDWAILEILRNADLNQNLPLSPVEFFTGQLMLMHPATAPVSAAGLLFLLATEAGRRFRALGWTFVVLFALLVILRGKIYYLAPAYPVLFAAGGVAVEAFFNRFSFAWLKPAFAVVLIIAGAIIAPLALPLLPVETFIAYAERLGVQPPQIEQNRAGKLPQHYADMHGWEEMTAAVARLYHNLPIEDRTRCAIFADNYGQAGAIDFFGARYNLPKAISPHQNYFLWGPRDYTGECVITVDSDYEDLARLCESVEPAGTFSHPYVMPYENDKTFYICRRMRVPLREYWSQVKCYSC